MKLKTEDLTGRFLDYAVATCTGVNVRIHKKKVMEAVRVPCPDNKSGCLVAHFKLVKYSPSTDGSVGMPLIEKYKIELMDNGNAKDNWCWGACTKTKPSLAFGRTALIAAMRALVLSLAGKEVEIPSELDDLE